MSSEQFIFQFRGHSINVAPGDYRWYWEAFQRDGVEPESYDVYDRYVTSVTTFLDVGAWTGPVTLYVANKAQKVYAFEPDPTAFGELENNLKLNPQLTNVKIIRAFVGTSEGVIKMGNASQRGNSQSSVLFRDGGDSWQADSIKLDRFIAENEMTSDLFIKMDIEGAEYTLLPTLKSLFLERKPTLLLSLHPFFLIATVPGKGLLAKIRKSLKLLTNSIRIIKSLERFPFIYDLKGRKVNLWLNLPKVLIAKPLVYDNIVVATYKNLGD